MNKNFWNLLALITLLFSMSCSNTSNDDISSERGRLNLAANVIYTDTNAASINNRSFNGEVILSEFKVNLSEIEFEVDDEYYDNSDHKSSDDDWDNDGSYDSEDDIELEGPFELDLLSEQVTFAQISLPNATYEEIEFEFDKNENPSSDLFNKTVLIKGTIGGTPFEFWTAFEEEFELDYEDASKNIVVDSNSSTIVITFNLDLLLSVIDFSTAVDGNQDGLIEIYNNDPDNNDALADQIKNKLKDYIDLLDD
ncbi:hypothetical protein [Ascidiimonas sp. W6]|uniref:hypothetical protein n=1 Tax=Ascidiimonas meishanensis TaxID=3128903 RepID=UPI0030EE84BE